MTRLDLTPRWLLAVAAAATLAGCATPPTTPEGIVAQRAQARWDAILSGDLQKAYGFLSPASRAITPFQTWIGTGIPTATRWKAAQVVKVDCDAPERCKARVNIDHQPLVFGGTLGTISSAVDETWLIDNGVWWLLYTR